MSTPVALVSLVVPARNEEADIVACLEAVLAQDCCHEELEVIVVDGASSDRTAERAASVLAGSDFDRWAVLPNEEASTPSNLNLGLGAARGEILVRVDARARVPPDYVRRCAEALRAEPSVAVVGGAQRAIAPTDGSIGKGIAQALNNRWVMGLSRYRRGAQSGYADTVYLGAFRTSQLRTLGGWDTRFSTNQDFDLNRRLSKLGTIWFEAGLDVAYIPRSSLKALFIQYHRFGRWKARYWRISGDRPRPRQVLLLLLPLVLPVFAVGVRVLSFSAIRRAGLAKGLRLASVSVVVLPCARSSSGRTQAAALGAAVAIATGWTSGVWREALLSERAGTSST